jgi:hypothetical protein
MSGTGFFDNFEAIDTSSEKGAIDKKPTPTVLSQGFQAPTKEVRETKKPSFNLPSGFEGSVPEAPTTDFVTKLKDHVPEQMKKEIEVLEEEYKEATSGVPSAKPTNWMQPSANPAWNQIKGARNVAHLFTKPPVMCGWAAPPKSGKTGSSLESLTDEEKTNGAEVHLLDFDTAGETTKSAHHAGSSNIVVLDPWVIDPNSSSRIPYDFPATYQKVMDILRAQIEMADKQNEYFRENGRMPNPYLKTVVFDGADQWLNICETLMKVEDLGLGVDGISVSGKPHKELLGSGRFNWNIRKVRYNSAITALQELSRRGVHVYLLTHMKKNYDGDGNVVVGGEVPAWLDGTEGKLQQLVIGEMVQERDATGKLTGVSESFVTLVENRASLYATGRVKIFRRDPAGSEWFGWPGLKDGSFSHPDDVKDSSE